MLVCDVLDLSGGRLYFCAALASAAVPSSWCGSAALCWPANFECMTCHEHHVYHVDTLHPTDAKI
jgi:hypothetical protein